MSMWSIYVKNSVAHIQFLFIYLFNNDTALSEALSFSALHSGKEYWSNELKTPKCRINWKWFIHPALAITVSRPKMGGHYATVRLIMLSAWHGRGRHCLCWWVVVSGVLTQERQKNLGNREQAILRYSDHQNN